MRRLNILIVMADQLTPFVLGCHGGQAVTPNIDALAARGWRFDAAYCNAPLCTPARMAFMTGRMPSRIGAWDNAAYLPSTVPTFAHYLRAMGYRCCLSGKMHFVGPDQLHGFEERLTTDVYPADFGWVPDWTRPDQRIDLWYHNMSSVAQAGPAAVTNQLAYDDEVGAQSLRWLYDAARGTHPRPFCHVASFIHPHDPYAARQRYWDLYDDVDIAPPALPRPAPVDNDPHSLRLERAIALDAVDLTADDVARARRAYLANVSYVDAWLGRLCAVLQETGQDENTAIAFVADHGDMLGERGLWYKMSPYEPSARVPLILAAPGLPGGRVVDTPASLVDLLPTLIDLAADGRDSMPEMIDPPDGASLLGSLDAERTVAVEYTAEATPAPILMLRRGRLKYVTSPADPDQLFDLAADPRETVNLTADPCQEAALESFGNQARTHWDVAAVHAAVLDSQRRRRVLSAALGQGARAAWDFQPMRDASDAYVRSHLELSDFDARMRWPRPPGFAPRWR